MIYYYEETIYLPWCHVSTGSELLNASSTSRHPPAGIDSIIPQAGISNSAYEHAAILLHPVIFNHSIRVCVYAKARAVHTSSTYSSDPLKLDLLFTACIFRDIGTTSTYNGSQRFEVEGADAAVNHLSQYEISEIEKHDVWTAIVIHTSPGIAERIGELSKLVRVAVRTDFGRMSEDWKVLLPLKEKLEGLYHRGHIEKVLGDVVTGASDREASKGANGKLVGCDV